MEREEQKIKGRLKVGADRPDVEIEPLIVEIRQTWLDKLEGLLLNLAAGVLGGLVVAAVVYWLQW